MIVPDFSGPLLERMEKLNGILSGKTEIILVGSSYGGLMASIFTLENSFLFIASCSDVIKSSRIGYS